MGDIQYSTGTHKFTAKYLQRSFVDDYSKKNRELNSNGQMTWIYNEIPADKNTSLKLKLKGTFRVIINSLGGFCNLCCSNILTITIRLIAN